MKCNNFFLTGICYSFVKHIERFMYVRLEISVVLSLRSTPLTKCKVSSRYRYYGIDFI